MLLIDDDASLREIFSISLQLDGYLIKEAVNGQDALELLLKLPASELPDCIVLDLMMPVMNGNNFLDILRTDYGDRFSHIPVIVCSGQGRTPKPSHFSLLLEKPIQLFKLTQSVEAVLTPAPKTQTSALA